MIKELTFGNGEYINIRFICEHLKESSPSSILYKLVFRWQEELQLQRTTKLTSKSFKMTLDLENHYENL